MYVGIAKADKEIQRLKRRDEMAKSKMAEAQEAIQEKNALLLQKAALAKEVEELKRSKAEEVAAARVEAIESFRTSEELKSYIMDRLVDEQLRWEDRLVRFNPSVEINFDTSGEPPAQSPPTDASVQHQRLSRLLRMPLLPSLEGVAFFMCRKAEGTRVLGSRYVYFYLIVNAQDRIVLEVISILGMRQRIAFGIVKLVSAGAADFDNLIRTLSCRAKGTFGRILVAKETLRMTQSLILKARGLTRDS
ncbi:hypothetical protein Prudu_021718 [Prunus dulcis]|uniref:Uncharacterized protein n=1 Tax=Prunus dulcis TaxID=3755 RepID=A0A4Y1RXX6_PRUDU|nr:hypothetical protein Prudu_021718 [Prunus dulcis]